MRNTIQGKIAFALLVLLSCSACPLESPEPLSSKGDEALDVQLLGKWSAIQKQGEEFETGKVAIYVFNSSEYYLVVSKDGVEEDRYAAHPTTISGKKFLNVRDLEGKENTYHFVWYTLSPTGELSIQFVREEPFEEVTATAEAIREVLELRINDPALFEESSHHLRKESAGE